MAGPTICAKLTIMGIVLRVTGSAGWRGCFKICDAAGTGVASPTGQLGMLPGQLEGDGIMIKIVPICINPVMTGQAIIPIRQEMGLHEIGLDLLVTGRTDGLVKFGVAISVTGTANKRRTVRLVLVGAECIPEGIV
jgi:hypothetical protein